MSDHGMILLDVNVNQTVEVNVHVRDLIHSVNELEMVYRWNVIAIIIKKIELNNEPLSDDHKKIIGDFLKEQVKKFK